MAFRCGLKRCKSDKPPSRLPTILIWAETGKKTIPAALEINLALCEECAATASPEEFLSEQGKSQIEKLIVLTKKTLPDWSTAELRWRDVPSTGGVQ